MAPTTYQCVNKIWNPPLINVWTKYGTHHDQCVNKIWHPPRINVWTKYGTHHDQCVNKIWYPPRLMCEQNKSDGNTFSRKDLLNKLHNGFDISSFTDTNILLLIISGPTALLALRVHNISITSCSVTITWDRIFSHLYENLARQHHRHSTW